MSSLYCTRCGKTFLKEVGFTRHMQRKFPCRKPLFTCICSKKFVSGNSLRTHKRVYCKNRMFDDILKHAPESTIELDVTPAPSPVMISEPPTIELNEILEPTPEVNNSTPTLKSESSQAYILNDLEGILSSWLDEHFQMERLYRIRKTTKNEIDNSLYHLLEDGLLTQQDYYDLSYTANLCFRLRELIMMPISSLKRGEIIEILTEFLVMKKIDKEAYLIICKLIC